MLARITVRSCENVRALHLRKATLPRMLQYLIPGVKRVSGSAPREMARGEDIARTE